MQIRNIFARQSDATAVGRKNEPTAGDAPASQATAPIEESTVSKGRAVQEILSQYDVTQISPRQYTEMLQKLRKAGAISDKDYQDLSQVRSDIEKQGVGADDEVDLLSLYSDKVRQAEHAADPEQGDLTALRGRLQWLQKFALVQGAEPAWLDAAA